jgi:uncharacterized protein
MPEYLVPGVYIEELEGPGSIQGVSTSTAGFLGITERGPEKLRLVTSMDQFLNIYGGFLPDNYLAYAVDGFFRNGGRRCFIARIVREGTKTSFAEEKFQIGTDEKILTIKASGPGEKGNNTVYKLEQASNGDPKSFNMTILYFKNEIQKLTHVGVNDGVFIPDPTHQFNRSLKKRNEPFLVEKFTNLNFNRDSQDYYKKHINGVSNLVTVTDDKEVLIPETIQSTKINIFDLDLIDSDLTQQGYLRDFLKWSFSLEWLEPPFTPDVDETARTITFKKDTNNIVIEYNEEKSLADVILNGRKIYKFSIESKKDVYSSNLIPLATGDDIGDPKLTDYQGREIATDEEDVKEYTGLKGFEKIDEISLVSSPDQIKIPGLDLELIDHCEDMKFRFAILQEDRTATGSESIKIERDSKYAADYVPWLWISHPESGNQMLIPPGGHIAGIYARTDITKGVSQSPAGVNATVKNIHSLQKQIDTAEQGSLTQMGVNTIIKKTGYGNVVWGARTLSKDANWRYIAVRRLFNMIEKSIEMYLQRVVFEPNTPRLWSRVVATITPFLSVLRRDGALGGKTDNEAFSVICDETTMTPEDIKQGKLIIRVAIRPPGVAEVIIVQFSQKSGFGAEIEEI